MASSSNFITYIPQKNLKITDNYLDNQRSSDVTKQYFRNFVVTFVQVSAQIVYMAVMYYVGARWTMQEIDASSMQSGADVLAWFMKFLPNTIVIIGIGIMMVKPPKALSNLIH